MSEAFWRDQGIKPAVFKTVFAVENFVDELNDWVEVYEIQKAISCDANLEPAEDLKSVSNSLIWTDQWSDGRVDFLTPGFELGSDEIDSWGVQGWYVGLEPWDEDAPSVASEIHIPCPNCFPSGNPSSSLEEKLQQLNRIKPIEWIGFGLGSGLSLPNFPGCEFCDHSTLIQLYLSDFMSFGS
jgi:hypothetical protein